MTQKLYLEEIRKNDANLLFNIPHSLRILERTRLNRHINEDDLSVIKTLMYDAFKSKRITKQDYSLVNDYTKNIKKLIRTQDKEKAIKQNILIRNETYYIEEVIKKYRYHLRTKASKINSIENNFYYYLPNELKKDIDDFSTQLLHSIDEMYRLRIDEKEREIFYKLLDISYEMNIMQLAKHLGVEYNYLWKLIEKFDRLCLIETIGGKRNSKRDRIVFPSLGATEYRDKRDGKEGIITGVINQNITPYLNWSKIKGGRWIEVYEFNSSLDNYIYVVTPFNLEGYGNKIIRSLGVFFEGDLERHLFERYNMKFSERGEDFANKDSLIAYLHQIEGIKESLYDEKSQRGEVLFDKIGVSHSS